MSREQLIQLLARIVADGLITEEQAAGILLNWRAIQDLEAVIPLPTAAAMAEPDDDDMRIALIAAAIAAGLIGAEEAARKPAPRLSAPSIYSSMSQHRTATAADALADQFEEQARHLAQQLARGEITLQQWQEAMRRATNRHIIADGALGAGRNFGRIQDRIREIAREQGAYLSRFADHIAGRRIADQLGTPGAPGAYSAEQISQRAEQYSAAARSFYFEANEAGAATETPPGWIVQYIARDDERTCSPCRRAQGFYLIGTGPIPGRICRGRQHCRCRRIIVFMPEIYARLTAEATTA